MLRIFTTQLPEWARPDHPVMRYELARAKQILKARERYLRALGVVLGALLLLGIGFLYATDLFRQPLDMSITDSIWRIFFLPALIIQVLLRVVVLSSTINAVGEERRRQTWDNLRATETGAELALRTRWAAMFYKMRGWLRVLMVMRVILIIGILYDLTAFRGGYLDMLTANIIPEVPLVIGVLLLAFIMTASILLPLTSVGLDASVGLFISSVFKQRVYATMTQIILIIFRVGLVFGLLLAMRQFVLVDGDVQVDTILLWLLVAAFAAMGDWGLVLLQLGALGNIWAMIPYSVFIGLALLVFVMLQALLTDGLLSVAVRYAEKHE